MGWLVAAVVLVGLALAVFAPGLRGAAVVLVGLALAVFAPGLRGAAVAVAVADDAVVRWLGELHAPGLEVLWQGLAYGGSWWKRTGTEPGPPAAPRC